MSQNKREDFILLHFLLWRLSLTKVCHWRPKSCLLTSLESYECWWGAPASLASWAWWGVTGQITRGTGRRRRGRRRRWSRQCLVRRILRILTTHTHWSVATRIELWQNIRDKQQQSFRFFICSHFFKIFVDLWHCSSTWGKHDHSLITLPINSQVTLSFQRFPRLID